jgi:pimeloyl-ACP methyl ester carboxylesterase
LPKPSVEADLPKMNIPFLIVLGEADEMVNFQEVRQSYKALPNATVVTLPGTNHDGVFNGSDLVLTLIKEFLAKVSKLGNDKGAKK